jgi:molybdenum cofactor cytidylyltransferase
MPEFALGVIILAAGASARMGCPKLLLPWGATTVLGHVIELWTTLHADQITVAQASIDLGISSELDRLGLPPENRILNANPAEGMFSSILCAACWDGWKPALTHWAIVLGDQPHLQPSFLRSLLDFTKANPDKIVQPSCRGRPRHPVLLPQLQFQALGPSKEPTLKSFLQNSAEHVKFLPSEDPGLDFDIDTPADYESARKNFLSP